MLSPHSTDAIPHMYWCYPSTVLNSLHSTDAIPPQHWTASTVLMLSLHSTDVIPYMYWCYPPQYCSYPFAVLNSLRSTDAIPLKYWCYSPTVLNSLRSTEPMLYGVKMFYFFRMRPTLHKTDTNFGPECVRLRESWLYLTVLLWCLLFLEAMLLLFPPLLFPLNFLVRSFWSSVECPFVLWLVSLFSITGSL